ncbi:hypothetical protein BGT96224_Ac31249 [Blumeria graminis f. sp. tritici 96224]|nr:hypothetical protein BGT96224_Ac31249 [Blumeria graminis f. sp. tritici 96224]
MQETLGAYAPDDFYNEGSYIVKYKSPRVNMDVTIKIGITFSEDVLYVKAAGDGQEIDCHPTDKPATTKRIVP